MKNSNRAVLAFTLSLAVAGSIAAKEKEASPKPAGGMTMMDMMGKSNMSCMATSDSLESLGKAVQEALKSDDKEKMKTALQRTDAHIAQMRSHMSTCMEMMNMMGGMMGGGMMGNGKSEGMMGGGMMGGKTPGEGKSPAAEKKDEAAEHEKRHPK